MKSIGILLALVLFAAEFVPPALAKDETTALRIVVQDEQGKPVPRASLIVRELKGKKKKKGGGGGHC
jgi:hypothetical protein